MSHGFALPALVVRPPFARVSHANLFAPSLRDLAVLDAQNPIDLGSHDAPQPDLTLLHRRAGGYATHPRAADVLLVVEVADTSLSYDREIKIPRYASEGPACGCIAHERERARWTCLWAAARASLAPG